MELLAELCLEEKFLQAVVLVPDDTFEEGIEQADDERRCHALRQEARALGDAAGDDGRDRRRKRAQEEEFDERQTLRTEARHTGAAAQSRRADKEGDAVSDRVADQKVGKCRDGEIDQDLAERVDLVLVAHRACFEKSKAAVHGEDENCTHEQKQHVGAALQSLDGRLKFRHAPAPRFSFAHWLGSAVARSPPRHRQNRWNICQGRKSRCPNTRQCAAWTNRAPCK